MRLVVNADDFGLTEGTNRAIIDAHRTGIVTSTSLLANGGAFDQAVALAHTTPTLDIGVHLTLTEGMPVARNSKGLTTQNGQLPLSNQPVVRALLTGRLPREAIRREFEEQIQKAIAAGIQPTHLDGHKYIHLLPGITAIVCDLARQYQIPAMRVPHHIIDPYRRFARIPGVIILTALSQLAHRTVRRYGVHAPDHFTGFVDTGHLKRSSLEHLLTRTYNGVTELVCHPAYPTPQLAELRSSGYNWIADYEFDTETATVSDPDLRIQLEKAGWIFCHFGDI